MFLNENNIVCDIMGIHMIINTENGAVVGVDDEGLEQYQRLTEVPEVILRIVETGSWSELMNEKGYFYKLYAVGQE